MTALDIPTVQAFLLVAELESFTRAAEALGTTQAAVSMKLQRLEAALRKRLVERSPRAVRLTAEGSAFLAPARALMEAHDRALAPVRPVVQQLSLGISDHAAGPELVHAPLLFLGVHINIDRIQWGWLFTYFLVGMLILGGLGIVLAGVSLVIARHGAFIGEVVAGMLLLFSCAYFPPEVLPPVLQQISLAMPLTYWLEGMRRALEGGILMAYNGTAFAPVSPILAAFDNWQLLQILSVSALISVVGSYFFYQWVEHAAKERGMIDRVTGY